MIIVDLVKNFFVVGRIFEAQPVAIGAYLYILILFATSFMAAIFLVIFKDKFWNKSRKVVAKIISLLFTFAAVGGILIFLRWQGVAYLGSRFTLLLLGAITFYWFWQILWYKYKILPQELAQTKEKERFTKYLPKNYFLKGNKNE